MGQYANAWVMERSPAVLSLGRRCMKEGFCFFWFKGRKPYLVSPTGKVIVLDVVGDIPYFRPGDPLCQPRDPCDEYPIVGCTGGEMPQTGTKGKGKARWLLPVLVLLTVL